MERLSEKARAAKNAYQKEWRKKNPDKVKAHIARHWEKKAAELEASANQEEVQYERNED